MNTIWELIQPPAHAPVLQSICESEQKINHIFHYFVYKAKKNICVYTVTCQKNLGSVGRD